MGNCNNKKITRRKFVKGVAGAALCYACLPLKSLSASDENSGIDILGGEGGNVQLAAACGTYCGACPAYLNKHGEGEKRYSSGLLEDSVNSLVESMNNMSCDGCLSGGTLAWHCQNCNIRLCAKNSQDNERCSGCDSLPCYRVTSLINQGDYPHRNEYLPNLEKIRTMGAEEWAVYEEARWNCPECGLAMSWYDAECSGCGEPRSADIFSLSFNISLNTGWNLISLPKEPAETAVASALGELEGKYISVWAYDGASWRVYDPAAPDFCDLSMMNAGKGYWINMKEAATLSFSDITPSPEVTLNKGWNLAGYNSLTARGASNVLASIEEQYISMWEYKSGWKVYDPISPDFSDLRDIKPGYGYWINSKSECSWALP